MSLQITLDPENGYIEARYEGNLTYGAALATLAAIENLMTSNPKTNRIYDLDSATLDWNLEDITAIIQVIDAKSNPNLDQSKVAFVHSGTRETAIINLFIEQANMRFDRDVRHFSSIDDARVWVTEAA